MKVDAGKRILSMAIDHIVMTLIIVAMLCPFTEFNLNEHTFSLDGDSILVSIACILIYFNKDIVGARSVGKRLLNFKIVDAASGKKAGAIQCFVRNIFCIIWPVEIIMTLKDPGKKIGDMIAGTRVEINEDK